MSECLPPSPAWIRRVSTVSTSMSMATALQVMAHQPGDTTIRTECHTAHLLTASGTSETWGTLPNRKSTRLNSSHVAISYAVFCLKKKKVNNNINYSKT